MISSIMSSTDSCNHHYYVFTQIPAPWALWYCLLLCSFIANFAQSKTDSSDVSALNVMYTSMNSPSQLDGWKSSGGDPCGDSWKGITCSGSKVTEIELSDVGLSGSLGYMLSGLETVTYFDLSKNNFNGNIPYQLPPNLQTMDLSGNDFNGNVPYSISQMSDLKELYLNDNQLNGQLSDMFGKLSKLTKMDLSSNKLSGDLPQSFKKLSSLSILYLQNNKFTGSINVLANLPLGDLNVANNKFTGWIPNELKDIDNLETGGNSWSSGPAPPPPPGTKSDSRAKESNNESENSGIGGAAIACTVLGFVIILGIVVAVLSRRSTPPPSPFIEDDIHSPRKPFTPRSSGATSNDFHSDSLNYKEMKSFKSSSSIKIKGLQATPSINLRLPSSKNLKSFRQNEFSNNLDVRRSSSVATYSLADLQTATGNFATGRLLGSGSIGRVYKAKCNDGRVLAVKKIDSSLFRGEEFEEIVSNVSRIRHPNVTELLGYCSEQGQNMLVHDYFRNGSLHEFLHLSDDFSKPLTWNTRVKIALGTARGIEYLHEVCSPACVHKNIKSSNILLNTDLNPCLSDCGLATFYERTSDNLGTGYNAPECTKPTACTTKSDVYSFGVVMLELLTGRLPFDSSKPRYEQSLVRWASPQLHDIDALAKLVDPALRGLYPPMALSQFADVVALCVQSEPEFRPPMSEVVQILLRLAQKSGINQGGIDTTVSRRTDASDY